MCTLAWIVAAANLGPGASDTVAVCACWYCLVLRAPCGQWSRQIARQKKNWHGRCIVGQQTRRPFPLWLALDRHHQCTADSRPLLEGVDAPRHTIWPAGAHLLYRREQHFSKIQHTALWRQLLPTRPCRTVAPTNQPPRPVTEGAGRQLACVVRRWQQDVVRRDVPDCYSGVRLRTGSTSDEKNRSSQSPTSAPPAWPAHLNAAQADSLGFCVGRVGGNRPQRGEGKFQICGSIGAMLGGNTGVCLPSAKIPALQQKTTILDLMRIPHDFLSPCLGISASSHSSSSGTPFPAVRPKTVRAPSQVQHQRQSQSTDTVPIKRGPFQPEFCRGPLTTATSLAAAQQQKAGVMVRCQLMLACLALAAFSSAQARVFSSDGEQGHRASQQQPSQQHHTQTRPQCVLDALWQQSSQPEAPWVCGPALGMPELSQLGCTAAVTCARNTSRRV